MFYRILLPALCCAVFSLSVTATESAADARAMVEHLATLQFDKLGHPQIQSDSIQPALASSERPHKLLILPVRFADVGYDRFRGDPAQDEKNRDYFQQLLFAGGAKTPEQDTLSHYYWHQSKGRYHITGDIFPVVELARPLHYYGRPVQGSDGEWRSDENSSDIVVDAIEAAYAAQPDFPWRDYDQWDPQDFDGDGNRDEPDGYIDHFVLIVAGKGQSDCQGLYKLGEKLNVTAAPDAFDHLTPAEQGCADRIWPHRSALPYNLDSGPQLDGVANVRGGIDIGNGLWLLDYNMQSEYTEVDTFIHEFGHSLGLPDIYARQTNNSTAAWDVMSSTAGPVPQEMSAWSRMVLGWLQPCVLRSPNFGGEKTGQATLKTMNDWSGVADSAADNDLCDAIMVILPPKYRDIELGPLGPLNGKQAAYSGQGNDMNRSLSRSFDFSELEQGSEVTLSMDLWFQIEPEWDYLYVELKSRGGEFKRIMPTDKSGVEDKNSVMPSAKGHEGKGSVPGFTGYSGDRDGDNKVETAPGCDPTVERKMAEDNIGNDVDDPCQQAQWVTAEFDLTEFAASEVTLRITYYTDMAAVENGALVDNIAIPAIDFSEDFEDTAIKGWDNRGFTLSTGRHHLAVPHFYVLEYRDPYEKFAAVKNYDEAISHPGFVFYPDPAGGMAAFSASYRPGVVMWYYNGEYMWSQNDPAEFGPGRGYLLVVDSTPQEFPQPGIPGKYFMQQDGWSWWEFDDDAQAVLEEGYVQVMCFQRRQAFYSSDVSAQQRDRCKRALHNGVPPMESVSWDDRKLMYGYTIINELLPGPERRARKGTSTLFDLRIREGKTRYRLYDRILRGMHSADAPFAIEPFERGTEIYKPVNGEMTARGATAFAPVSEFSDARPNRYLSPKLPFGGADIPEAGFSYKLRKPAAGGAAKVIVDYRWREL
jgi:immune inhibitor A